MTQELVKPVPDGVDDWSHPYHGPDNNPQSRDQVARAPYLTQFLADPRYAPLPQVAVAAGGRVFKAFGHIAFKEREEPWLDTLAAFRRLQRHAALETPDPGGADGAPQHVDRHAHDALLRRRQVLQGDRRRDRSRRATKSRHPPMWPAARSGNGWRWRMACCMR